MSDNEKLGRAGARAYTGVLGRWGGDYLRTVTPCCGAGVRIYRHNEEHKDCPDCLWCYIRASGNSIPTTSNGPVADTDATGHPGASADRAAAPDRNEYCSISETPTLRRGGLFVLQGVS